MCALSCSGAECQRHTNVLVVVGDFEVVLRAHLAKCFLLKLPVSDSIHELARREAWQIVLHMGMLMIVL